MAVEIIDRDQIYKMYYFKSLLTVIEPAFSVLAFFRPVHAEVSDLHMGREDASALEETGEFQAGVAERYAA